MCVCVFVHVCMHVCVHVCVCTSAYVDSIKTYHNLWVYVEEGVRVHLSFESIHSVCSSSVLKYT